MSDHFCMTLIPSYDFASIYLGVVLLFGCASLYSPSQVCDPGFLSVDEIFCFFWATLHKTGLGAYKVSELEETSNLTGFIGITIV